MHFRYWWGPVSSLDPFDSIFVNGLPTELPAPLMMQSFACLINHIKLHCFAMLERDIRTKEFWWSPEHLQYTPYLLIGGSIKSKNITSETPIFCFSLLSGQPTCHFNCSEIPQVQATSYFDSSFTLDFNFLLDAIGCLFPGPEEDKLSPTLLLPEPHDHSFLTFLLT